MRPQAPVDLDRLTVIAQACRDEERLRFGYRRRDGEEAERTVEPHRLVALDGRWYLVAWDVRRTDWRTFRVDRITAPHVTGSRCARRRLPGGDAAEFVRQSIRSMPQTWTAEVTVFQAAGELPAEIHWLRTEVEPIDATSCRLRTAGSSLPWLAMHLAFLSAEYRIDGPPELRDYVREDAARRLRGAGA